MTTAEILKKNNIRPSVIRVMVYDFLRNTDSHPTADEIYNELAPSVPTLSKTSVYNTVRILADAGLSKSITIDGMQTRYDADVSTHGHFLCNCCSKVYDFRLDTPPAAELDGFRINSRQVYYSGVCPDCINRGKALYIK